ncbi:MAG: prepilin-type N-terminal cleavage/methylation domain-containing protein [Planctomycetota bacterium]
MRRRGRRTAFTLVEMMVCTVLITAIAGFAAVAYHRYTRFSLGFLRNARDIRNAVTAGERWRADVRKAAAEPQVKDGVLVIPQAGRPVAYRQAGATVERRIGDAGWRPFLVRVKSSRMQAVRRKRVRSWRWEIEMETRADEVRIRPLFTFETVPGHATK